MSQRSLARAEQLRNDAEIRQRVDERHKLEDQQTARAAAEVTITITTTTAAVAITKNLHQCYVNFFGCLHQVGTLYSAEVCSIWRW